MRANDDDSETLLPLHEAAVASLDSVAGYLRRIETSLARAVEDFRTGRVGDANDLYAQILDALHVVVVTLSATGNVLEEPGLRAIESGAEPCILALLGAQERRDWVSVSDALEYELQPLLEAWAKEIHEVKGRIASEESATEGESHGERIRGA